MGKFEIEKSDAEWQKKLSEEQFRVTRKEKTELAFSGIYCDHKAAGTYHCVCCDQPLWSSISKYDSGTGWPSYWEPLVPDAIGTRTDRKLLVKRTEIHCNRCGAHQGHVFSDGPKPSGLRYCVNSVAIHFKPDSGST